MYFFLFAVYLVCHRCWWSSASFSLTRSVREPNKTHISQWSRLIYVDIQQFFSSETDFQLSFIARAFDIAYKYTFWLSVQACFCRSESNDDDNDTIHQNGSPHKHRKETTAFRQIRKHRKKKAKIIVSEEKKTANAQIQMNKLCIVLDCTHEIQMRLFTYFFVEFLTLYLHLRPQSANVLVCCAVSISGWLASSGITKEWKYLFLDSIFFSLLFVILPFRCFLLAAAAVASIKRAKSVTHTHAQHTRKIIHDVEKMMTTTGIHLFY